MPDFTAAIALLKKPIEDVYSISSDSLKKKIAVFRASSKVKSLHGRLWQIQKVKTIWNTDRPLSLTNLYHPVDVNIIGEDYNVIRRVDSVNDLIHTRCVIYGTAGQGKSILMKYLVGREIRSGERIPLLCELRDVGPSNLDSFLSKKLSVLIGINQDDEIFHAFANSGKISLLLDGFDEVDQDAVQSLLQQIDILAFKYPNTKIIVTSRPQSDCRNLTSFYSANIKPLSESDLLPFYKKITKDTDFSKRIISAIENSPSGIRSLITTPLLATLLAISYRAAHKIPIEFSEFYEELFQVLLVRHDAAKMGWRRKRNSGLTDRQIQQVFEAFCFAVRRKKAVSVELDEALDLIDRSISDASYTVDAQVYLDDVRRITCLVLQEGRKIEFVHASVAHYFASRFVKSRTEIIGKRFYEQLLNRHWSSWIEEIRFLRQIDTHRFSKYFQIPDLELTIRYFEGDGRKARDLARTYISSFKVIKRSAAAAIGGYTYTVALGGGGFHSYSALALRNEIFSLLFPTAHSGAKPWTHSFAINPDANERTYLEIAEDRGESVVRLLEDQVALFLARAKNDLSLTSAMVERGELITDFVTLD